MELAQKARNHGLEPKEVKMNKPFTVQGVGSGTNEAKWEAHLPIAVTDDQGNVRVHEYHAPTVSGSGAELPALLGLESMSSQRGILEMTEGQEYLTFPGPDGYRIQWAPGARRYKLERAPSGHLILPCDAFIQGVEPGGGVNTPSTQWRVRHADEDNKVFSSSGPKVPAVPMSSL